MAEKKNDAAAAAEAKAKPVAEAKATAEANAAARRRGMTPQEAAELGLDPTVYGG